MFNVCFCIHSNITNYIIVYFSPLSLDRRRQSCAQRFHQIDRFLALSSSAEERRLAAVSVFQAQTEAPSLPEPQQDRHQHADRRGESPCGQQAQRTQGELRRRAAAPQDDVFLLMTSSSPSDGRGHGPTNERASQMVTGQPRVFRSSRLDRDCQTVGQ